MAIFQKAYRGYDGARSSSLQRIFVIFRYALADVFSSRLFTAFFSLCFLLPLALLCLIYALYNLDFLLQFDIALNDLPEVDGDFFLLAVQYPQNMLLFVLIVWIGPAMISPDLRNNAMPLYLSRSISKASYILGKLLVLVFLGSLISWVPTFFLVLLQAYLAQGGWLFENWHIPLASLTLSLSWIVTLSLIAFAISAWVNWKPVARMALFGLILFGSILGGVMEEVFGGWGAYLVNIYAALEVLMMSLYGADSELLGFVPRMPVWIAALQFLGLSLLALIILTRRIRAFQVVA